ncbi:hypothetical protein GAMM_160012 [Gammaproteobacteria bacterium]
MTILQWNDLAATKKTTFIVASHDRKWLENVATRIIKLKNGLYG